MKCRITRHFIRVFTVCQSTRLGVSGRLRASYIRNCMGNAGDNAFCVVHIIDNKVCLFLFVLGFSSWSTAMTMSRRFVYLTALFPGQA